MSRYQPYQSYKSSQPWLGNIPTQWQEKRFKHIFALHKGKNQINDPIVLSVTLSGIKIKDIHSNEGQLAASYDNYNPVTPDNIIFNPMDLISGFVGRPKVQGVVSPAYTSLKAIVQCNLDYFVYYIQKHYHERIFFPFGQGVSYDHRWTINNETFLNLPLLSPPLSEQAAIANFLNRETAKIDILIAKQQRLIELLKEKRQAVISHAVTKGLDPNVKMKYSGIEWLGEVPEHWNLPKIKWFCKTDSGGTPTTSKYAEYYENGRYPWLRTTDLNNGELFEAPIYITQKALADTACNIIPINSILIGMYGGAGTIGKHALLRFSATINQAVCAITTDKRSLPEYLHYFMQFYRPYWMIGAEGTRKDPNIGQETIREASVILPSISEQMQIVKHLDIQIAKINTLIEKANKAIDLMKERRTALISAAVTGKIDVREMQ